MIMIKGVHEGAPRADLDTWLAANGLKDSRWYMAEPRPYVENKTIIMVQVDTPKVNETGCPIVQRDHHGSVLTLVVSQQLLVDPPKSIFYRATS